MSSLTSATTLVPGVPLLHPEPSSSTTKSLLQAAVDAAVWWWGDFLKKSSLPLDVVKKFEDVLREHIIQKISDHWYPEMPAKGQAFRSLLVDKKAHIDPILSRSAATVGIDNLITYFTKVDSVLMWIDPDVVIVRIAYTGYSAVPPEDKILYRSNLGAGSLKIVSAKPLKTSTPPPIARPGILRTSPPGSPSSNNNSTNASFLSSYRSSSPGLNSNAAQYFPTSMHFTHPSVSQFPKPAYIPAQRHPTLLYNNIFNQTQYMSWPNSNPGPYTENWNDNQVTSTSQQPQNQPQSGTNRQQPNKMYIDYIESVLPLEAQA
jgi:hypothetical protein